MPNFVRLFCRVEISKEFQKMLDAVDEDISQGGDGLIDESRKPPGHTITLENEENDQQKPEKEEDPSLLDIGTLAATEGRQDDGEEAEKLYALLEGLMLDGDASGASHRRGMFDEGGVENHDTESNF